MNPSLARPTAVLFDWDDTLIENWEPIHAALTATLAAMGHEPWSFEKARRRSRRSLRDSFPRVFGERWEEARDIFYASFPEDHLKTLAAMPGAEEVLRLLFGASIYLGVVSNKQGGHLRREASHLGWDRYFGRLVGASDASEDKPATAPVELALEGSGIARGEHVWFVGDGMIDLECARNAGCFPVLLRDTPPSPGEFGTCAPALHVRDCREFRALVREL